MPTITFIESNGREHIVDGKLGASLMETAKKQSVPGIDADCGGGCQCGTCHIYVEPNWQPHAGEACALEAATLGFASNVRENSRLSCQMKITADLDGLIVRIPATQR